MLSSINQPAGRQNPRQPANLTSGPRLTHKNGVRLAAAAFRLRRASAPSRSGRILDSLSTSVLIVDRARAILYLNVAAETLFGIRPQSGRGRPSRNCSRQPPGGCDCRARARTSRHSCRELALRPVNGEGGLIVDRVAPYEESAAPAVLIEISDATQHQRISRETALLTQIDGRRLMIRQLAHEIKNPLGGLRGAAQLLARELPEEHMREYTSVIISEADRLAGLVDAARCLRRAAAQLSPHQHVRHLLAADAPPERRSRLRSGCAARRRTLIRRCSTSDATRYGSRDTSGEAIVLRACLTNVNIGARGIGSSPACNSGQRSGGETNCGSPALTARGHSRSGRAGPGEPSRRPDRVRQPPRPDPIHDPVALPCPSH